MQPFAQVDEVMDGGPAEAAGLCVGDLVLLFGNVSAENNRELRAVGDVVSTSMHQAVSVVVRRGTAEVELSLMPQPWIGQGLLGLWR